MSTQTFSHSLLRSLPFHFGSHRTSNPFLNALQHIEYGRITIVGPAGNKLKFSGSQAGPDAHLQLRDWKVLDDFVARGEMGLADAYIAGRWESDDLPGLIAFGLVNSPSLEAFFHGKPWYALWAHLRSLLQSNTLKGSRRNIMAHYDLGNDFYALWLDDSMTYSCALFENDAARTLEEAQAAKYRRILNKLSPEPGQHILDLGCGWGGFAEFAARRGMKVTGVTISEKQASFARARMERTGLSHLASIELLDYRKVSGTFDYIVSIGMFEHVGEAYWPAYFETIKRLLKKDGKAMVQTITLDDYLFESLHSYRGFVEQVIFPGGMLPSKSRFHAAVTRAGLECREMYAFGQDYARTTREWLKRFEKQQWAVREQGYDDRFIRLWRFYLSCCIASFSSHRTDVMQTELTHA